MTVPVDPRTFQQGADLANQYLPAWLRLALGLGSPEVGVSQRTPRQEGLLKDTFLGGMPRWDMQLGVSPTMTSDFLAQAGAPPGFGTLHVAETPAHTIVRATGDDVGRQIENLLGKRALPWIEEAVGKFNLKDLFYSRPTKYEIDMRVKNAVDYPSLSYLDDLLKPFVAEEYLASFPDEATDELMNILGKGEGLSLTRGLEQNIATGGKAIAIGPARGDLDYAHNFYQTLWHELNHAIQASMKNVRETPGHPQEVIGDALGKMMTMGKKPTNIAPTSPWYEALAELLSRDVMGMPYRPTGAADNMSDLITKTGMTPDSWWENSFGKMFDQAMDEARRLFPDIPNRGLTAAGPAHDLSSRVGGFLGAPGDVGRPAWNKYMAAKYPGGDVLQNPRSFEDFVANLPRR